MKNLPDDKLMEDVRNRLANYAEEPDEDDWDKIAAAIPKAGSNAWLKYAVFLILFIFYSSGVWLAGRYSTDQNKKEIIPATSDMIKSDVADSCEWEVAKNVDETPKTAFRKSGNDPVIVRKEKSRFIDLIKVIDEEPLAMVSVDDKDAQPSDLNYHTDSLLANHKSSIEYEKILSASKDTHVANKDTVFLSPDSLVSKSQNSELQIESKKEEKKSKSRPAIYFLATPSLAFQNIAPNLKDDILITKLNQKGVLSADRIGVSIDMGLQWQLTKKIVLYSGLSYYQQNTSISYSFQSQDVKKIEESTADFSYVLTPGNSSTSFNYKMKNAGIAAGFLYHLQGVKLQHKIGAGLQYQVGLLQEQNHFNNRGSSYLNYQILYRIEFAVHSKYHFYFQPVYTHLINSNEDMKEPFDLKSYRAGIGLGVIRFF